jgi:hypothetical protein
LARSRISASPRTATRYSAITSKAPTDANVSRRTLAGVLAGMVTGRDFSLSIGLQRPPSSRRLRGRQPRHCPLPDRPMY